MRVSPAASPDRRAPVLPVVSAARAFTLIELLVVIAIVGVLVAVAVPLYAKVTLTSKESKTVRHLRNLQTANIQYANDHNGKYVPYRETGPVTVNGDTRTDAYWWYNPEFVINFESGKDVYYYSNPPDIACTALIPMSVSKTMTTSFGYNVDALTNIPPYWPPATRQSSSIPSMSRLMAFADSQDCQIQNSTTANYKLPEQHVNYAVAYRYNNMANVVFFDGHVELLPKDKVVNNMSLWRGENLATPQP